MATYRCLYYFYHLLHLTMCILSVIMICQNENVRLIMLNIIIHYLNSHHRVDSFLPEHAFRFSFSCCFSSSSVWCAVRGARCAVRGVRRSRQLWVSVAATAAPSVSRRTGPSTRSSVASGAPSRPQRSVPSGRPPASSPVRLYIPRRRSRRRRHLAAAIVIGAALVNGADSSSRLLDRVRSERCRSPPVGLGWLRWQVELCRVKLKKWRLLANNTGGTETVAGTACT